MRVLSFNNLISTNGDGTLLSITTKMANEIAETMKAIPICGRILGFIPLCTRVSAIRNEIIVIESTEAPFMSIEGDVLFLLLLCSVLTEAVNNCPLFSFTSLAIITVTTIANGTMDKKVECHPNIRMIVAPAKRPTTEPAEYADPNTPTAMASFAGGNVSLRRLNAAGTAANPTPWIILVVNRNVILCANPPAVIPATYRVNSTSNTFFLPYRSDILPAIGVITAATIRYELNIHAAVPYVILKSFMISGMAGRSIVSEKNTTNNVLLSIPRVIHA